MILKPASSKAIRFACMNYHYAKTVPSVKIAHAVFEKNEFCGVICYGSGASARMGESIGLKQGQFLELVRVALNGKQSQTSKALSISLRLLKRKAPTVRAVVSYADKGQNHTGTIYQATNWKLIEDINSSGTEYFYQGQWRHDRGRYSWNIDFKKLPKRKKAGKYKYLYPFDSSLEFKELKYPKRG